MSETVTPAQVALDAQWAVVAPPPARLLDPPCSKVTLVGLTQHPLGFGEGELYLETDTAEIIAQVAQTFEGVCNPGSVHDGDIQRILGELQKTAVAAPFQMVHMTWLLEDVTRSFTHQLVRYRVGTAYTQQSLRFHGAEPIRIRRSNDSARFEQSAKDAVRNYWQLRNEGVHPQFARGILPLDTVSWIWFSCSFASLQHIFRQRMTVQAQPGEWQEVLTQMHDLLPANLRPFLRSCCTSGGPCPFASMWDRPCPGRPDSQAQHPAGAKIAEQALENIGG